MRQVVPNIYMIDGLHGGNVYLITSSNELTLVDSGTHGEVERIADQIKGENFDLTNLKTIILTHAHGDHSGNAAELAHRSGAKVMAHRDDAPYIESAKSYPASTLF
jgi:glyoxylase-like metal-dependent hydrolase (beta-lactamase superfamily II)